MGFKITQKGKGAEVKILRHENEEYVGKFGIIQRVSMTYGVAYVKLVNEQIEVKVPMKDLLIP